MHSRPEFWVPLGPCEPRNSLQFEPQTRALSCSPVSFRFCQSLKIEPRLTTRSPELLTAGRHLGGWLPRGKVGQEPTQGKAEDRQQPPENSLQLQQCSSFSVPLWRMFLLITWKRPSEKDLTKHGHRRTGKGSPMRVSPWQVKATQFLLRKNRCLIILCEDRHCSRWKEIGKCEWALQFCRNRGRKDVKEVHMAGSQEVQLCSLPVDLTSSRTLGNNNNERVITTFVHWILCVKKLLSALYVSFHLGF